MLLQHRDDVGAGWAAVVIEVPSFVFVLLGERMRLGVGSFLGGERERGEGEERGAAEEKGRGVLLLALSLVHYPNSRDNLTTTTRPTRARLSCHTSIRTHSHRERAARTHIKRKRAFETRTRRAALEPTQRERAAARRRRLHHTMIHQLKPQYNRVRTR
jgi:hypothetical protein